MLSTENGYERYRSIVGTKLRLLIAGDCDINQCESMGLTPSQHAIKNSCWYEWCYALKYNGMNFHEVIFESKALQRSSFLELSRGSYRDNLPLDDDLSSPQMQSTHSLNLLALRSYIRWKRTHIAVFVYFLVTFRLL